MDMQLANKVAVVTGANKGIGLAVVHALLDEGAHVVAGSRNVENLASLDRVTPVSVNLLAPEAPRILIEQAVSEHGGVDVLVNNVGGVRIRVDGFLATSDDDFQWAFDLNFFTALRAIRAALPSMIERGGGAIVNTASVNAFFQPDSATIDYGAAKAAVVNLSKALSQELGAKGVRVNCVSPGPVGTDLWLGEHGVAETIASATGVSADAAREAVTAGVATGRFSTPGEVAALIVMLASNRLGNVTGANYWIDGGLIKTI